MKYATDLVFEAIGQVVVALIIGICVVVCCIALGLLVASCHPEPIQPPPNLLVLRTVTTTNFYQYGDSFSSPSRAVTSYVIGTIVQGVTNEIGVMTK